MSPEPEIRELSTEPPAGPTVMAQAHADGFRQAVALLKNRLTEPARVEETVRATVLTYLEQWAAMYARGAREAASPTERVIIQIRQDTMAQLARELLA